MIALWSNFTFARVIFNFFTNDDDEDEDDDDDEFRNLDPRRASSRVKIINNQLITRTLPIDSQSFTPLSV